MLSQIRTKVEAGQRVTKEEGLYLLKEAHLLDLAPVAQLVRSRHNPEPVVTFVVDTNLNYTNVCDAYCTFCAFYRTERDPDRYTHTVEQVMEQVARAEGQGVTTVLLQGGLNPSLPLEYYEDLVRETRRRHPSITPHFFSAPEVQKMAQVSGLSLREVLQRLKAAGQYSIPGGGSEVLSDRVKHRISRLFPKGRVADWVDVHREAHRLGFKTTATMMYGHLEEPEDIIAHLDTLRSLQDEHHGFTAFIHWSYKRENTALATRVKEEAGPNPYLRLCAVARIYLDNFPHIQASWFSEGAKTGQVALHFGADDFGGTLFDETVMQEAGWYNRTTVEEVVSLIQEAGFVPAQRNTLYEILRYYPAPATTGPGGRLGTWAVGAGAGAA
ncbi:MAG: dehypoxanthine futalosine cyclase [Chloroflexi bacterium]|nr:dehypoxanthine futalosine cyclase [Chloroflexota bacterium]